MSLHLKLLISSTNSSFIDFFRVTNYHFCYVVCLEMIYKRIMAMPQLIWNIAQRAERRLDSHLDIVQ